jgi:hypothetical protein
MNLAAVLAGTEGRRGGLGVRSRRGRQKESQCVLVEIEGSSPDTFKIGRSQDSKDAV